MLFSRRNGIEVEKSIQLDSMDEGLKNRLWNCLHDVLFESLDASLETAQEKMDMVADVLQNHFKVFAHEVSRRIFANSYKKLLEIYCALEWNEVYDLFEVFLSYRDKCLRMAAHGVFDRFVNCCNVVLEEESSAYRISGNRFTTIIGRIEMNEINLAVSENDDYIIARRQLLKALDLLSKRPSPDLENSVKEAIMSLETLLRKITGHEGETLQTLLRYKCVTANVHPTLIESMVKLYGYSSDMSGVRHGYDDAKPDLTKTLTNKDAKLILVICSALMNYLAQLDIDRQ